MDDEMPSPFHPLGNHENLLDGFHASRVLDVLFGDDPPLTPWELMGAYCPHSPGTRSVYVRPTTEDAREARMQHESLPEAWECLQSERLLPSFHTQWRFRHEVPHKEWEDVYPQTLPALLAVALHPPARLLQIEELLRVALAKCVPADCPVWEGTCLAVHGHHKVDGLRTRDNPFWRCPEHAAVRALGFSVAYFRSSEGTLYLHTAIPGFLVTNLSLRLTAPRT